MTKTWTEVMAMANTSFTLDSHWFAAFEQAWEAYSNGSVPIGAVVVSDDDRIVAVGRATEDDQEIVDSPISGTELSHAELSTLIQLKKEEHPNVKGYTLYSTMEPCPLCFGAFIMSNVGTLKYAARDSHCGSTELLDKSDYLRSRNVRIDGPFHELEIIQIALQTAWELENGGGRSSPLIERFYLDYPVGTDIGKRILESGYVTEMRSLRRGVSELIAHILAEID
jgi:tRNA(adenine34) deaminase